MAEQPPPQYGQGYESLGPLGPNEPPPPPVDPLNPGAGIPLRDDGIDLDELSGSSQSHHEKKKKDGGSKHTQPKDQGSNPSGKKSQKNGKNSQRALLKKSSTTVVKNGPLRSDNAASRRPTAEKVKIHCFWKFGSFLGPIVIALGAFGVISALVVYVM